MTFSIRSSIGSAAVILSCATLPATAQRQQPIVPIPGDPRTIDATAALPGLGEVLPAFRADLLTGDSITAHDLVGAPAIVAIWSTDCPGSRQAWMSLEDLFAALSPNGVQFLVLATDSDITVLEEFVRSAATRIPIAQVPPDEVRRFIRSRRVRPAEPFQVVFAKPSFLVIDAVSVIIAREGGGLGQGFARHVKQLLSGPQ